MVDTTPPTIACPGNLVVSNDTGSCGAIVNFTVTADDDCDANPSVGCVPMSGSFFAVGTTSVDCTATDRNGLSATCSFTVTVNDDEDPMIVGCPANDKVSNDPGECSAVYTWIAPTATDNCPGVIIDQTGGPANGSALPVGITTIEYTATDAAGNTAVCTFSIEVNDTEDPVITCPADITQDNDAGLCSAVVNYTATATDNCPGVIRRLHAGERLRLRGRHHGRQLHGDRCGRPDGDLQLQRHGGRQRRPGRDLPGQHRPDNDPGECGADRDLQRRHRDRQLRQPDRAHVRCHQRRLLPRGHHHRHLLRDRCGRQHR